MTYASGTEVPVNRTRAEIESLLQKYGASRIGAVIEPHRVSLAFTIGEWGVRFKMPLPTEDEAIRECENLGRLLGKRERIRFIEQPTRARWRALLLTIKAKLVSIENGVETFEEAFMAHLVLRGSGKTVGEANLATLRESNSRLLLSAGTPQ